MWNLKNKTNEWIQQNRNRLTDIENKVSGYQWGNGRESSNIKAGDYAVQTAMIKVSKLKNILYNIGNIVSSL